ncbi:RHS repeat-associated core domain-containing protein [Pseudescherichia sp.]|uniref:RHS repeat-associated core domain-containing protein n=1 Tax=Pseudescherichia sp. TaxID=2055881 RepID=UPI0028994A89|nr:RHS repeat-associated core domain-containing protein [Pseudescherichia sp.]
MSLQLIGTNQKNSTLLACDGNTQQVNFYSSFGNVNSVQNGQLPGFNGERPDPFTGVSHLGNGYRAYNPILMRFNCPDNQSPFGVGGINPYAYCENDPLNFTDPSGHGIITLAIRALRTVFKVVKVLAKVIAKTSRVITGLSQIGKIATGLSAYSVANRNPEAAVKLAHASSAFGWINVGAGFISSVDDVYGSIKRFKEYRELSKELSQILSESITGIDELGAENGSLAREASEAMSTVSHDYEGVENIIESAPEKSVRRPRLPSVDRMDVEEASRLVLQVIDSASHTASVALKSASSAMKKKNPDMSEKLKISSMIVGEIGIIASVPKTIGILKKAAKKEGTIIITNRRVYSSEDIEVTLPRYTRLDSSSA